MRNTYFDRIGKEDHLGERTFILSSLANILAYLIDTIARDNVVFDTGPAKIAITTNIR